MAADKLTAVQEVLKNAVVPALTKALANPHAASLVWDVMKLMPYHGRYSVYGHVKALTLKEPQMMLAKAHIRMQSKDVLNRISNETERQQGRALGKCSHSNPIVVFDHVVTNMTSMPNLIDAMVNTLRYITPLSFDVLMFTPGQKISTRILG